MADYISREEVLNEAEKVSLRDRNYRTYGNVVRSIPAADVVEVRHGRWVEQHSDFDLCGIVYYECSECKREQQVKWHYCPHCGARMGEAGNE